VSTIPALCRCPRERRAAPRVTQRRPYAVRDSFREWLEWAPHGTSRGWSTLSALRFRVEISAARHGVVVVAAPISCRHCGGPTARDPASVRMAAAPQSKRWATSRVAEDEVARRHSGYGEARGHQNVCVRYKAAMTTVRCDTIQV
jgi:hypothetical protein